MLATETRLTTQFRDTQLRCGACRYYVHQHCSHSAARLDGQEAKAGECPYFRFSQGGMAAYG